MTGDARLPLVALVGPTASGKSALAIWLAERLNAEVLACDSTQLYRGFTIGTAKPDAHERHGVPHHLLDVLVPNEVATAGSYRQMAITVLADLRRRARLPIFTVGTGLYVRALLEGLAEAPPRSEELRGRLQESSAEHPAGHLHRLLKRMDPQAARRIAAADEQKLVRAIEVCLLAKRPISQIHHAGRAPLAGWRAVKIGLLPPRPALYERIQARMDAMLARGWIEEVRSLIDEGFSVTVKPFEFIGYRELRAHLRGELSFDQARSLIAQATRRYAKRQLTWFRKEPGVHWLLGFGDAAETRQQALSWLDEQGIVRATPAAGLEEV